MTTPEPCRVWIGIVRGGVAGTTIWLNGNPDVLAGGTSFAVPGHFPGEALYLTACGTGDAALSVNFGGSLNSFGGRVPAGFYPGWPVKNGVDINGFDPASFRGSAGFTNPFFHPPPLQTIAFPTVVGLAQTIDGHTAGAYYIEYQTTYDIFSNLAGVGISKSPNGVAPNVNSFPAHGAYDIADPNGGLAVNGGFNASWMLSLAANGVTAPALPAWAVDPTGTTIALAIYITQPDNTFRPNNLTPVAMSCVPCTPLVMTPGWPGRYG
jgi:hypothetical protein